MHLAARLRELEAEADSVRAELAEMDTLASQTEAAIYRLLSSVLASGNINLGLPSDAELEAAMRQSQPSSPLRQHGPDPVERRQQIPTVRNNVEVISDRFMDRTIPQAVTLLLREEGGPLHVNELYNRLLEGGFKFTGQNPTISVAVSLNRNTRFRKVAPGNLRPRHARRLQGFLSLVRLMRAIVLSAGYGTRLWPLTEDRTKPAIPIFGKPLVGYVAEYLAGYGIDEIVVNLHHRPESVRRALGDGSQFGVKLHYVEEPVILGTSGALDNARDVLRRRNVCRRQREDHHGHRSECRARNASRSQRIATLVLLPNARRERFQRCEHGRRSYYRFWWHAFAVGR